MFSDRLFGALPYGWLFARIIGEPGPDSSGALFAVVLLAMVVAAGVVWWARRYPAVWLVWLPLALLSGYATLLVIRLVYVILRQGWGGEDARFAAMVAMWIFPRVASLALPLVRCLVFFPRRPAWRPAWMLAAAVLSGSFLWTIDTREATIFRLVLTDLSGRPLPAVNIGYLQKGGDASRVVSAQVRRYGSVSTGADGTADVRLHPGESFEATVDPYGRGAPSDKVPLAARPKWEVRVSQIINPNYSPIPVGVEIAYLWKVRVGASDLFMYVKEHRPPGQRIYEVPITLKPRRSLADVPAFAVGAKRTLASLRQGGLPGGTLSFAGQSTESLTLIPEMVETLRSIRGVKITTSHGGTSANFELEIWLRDTTRLFREVHDAVASISRHGPGEGDDPGWTQTLVG